MSELIYGIVFISVILKKFNIENLNIPGVVAVFLRLLRDTPELRRASDHKLARNINKKEQHVWDLKNRVLETWNKLSDKN